MITHTALGLLPANTWTGIDALAIHTSLVGSTLRAACTFWTTCGRLAYELGETRADRLLVYFATTRVGSAGRGLAGIHIDAFR